MLSLYVNHILLVRMSLGRAYAKNALDLIRPAVIAVNDPQDGYCFFVCHKQGPVGRGRFRQGRRAIAFGPKD